MKRHLIIFSLIFLSFSLISCSKREPVYSTDPGGILDQSSILKGKVSGTLTPDHSPYRVSGIIEVDSMSTLTIEPGVSIYFSDSAGLVVKGKLVAQGTREQPVFFTKDNDNSSWNGIQFINTRNNSQLSFAIIEEIYINTSGTLDIGAVNLENSSVTIHNSIIRHTHSPQGGGICLISSTAEIKNNVFMDNHAAYFGGAILAVNTDLVFINNSAYMNSSENYGGGLVIRNAGISQIENNIFYKNSGQSGDPGVAFSGDSSKSIIKYNFTGYGVVSPLFISDTDMHLLQDSPCINQGDPTKEFNDTDNSRNDQGAYGGPLGDW
ncbi:MAG TPA: right-handed parallel beta-helix repeat-containing protein [Ignavibacteriales bacterium]|nr:right-handed parallel beta-helix repeat-containing protein [Ignavibacteriales bacterium]